MNRCRGVIYLEEVLVPLAGITPFFGTQINQGVINHAPTKFTV